MNPDEFYVYMALQAGRPAILKRGIGGKATKMVYTGQRRLVRTTDFVEVDQADRRRFSLSDADVTELAREALAIEEHYGDLMTLKRATGLTAGSTSPGTAGDGEVEAVGRHCPALLAPGTRPCLSGRPRHRAEDRCRRRVRASCARPPRCTCSTRVRCWRPI